MKTETSQLFVATSNAGKLRDFVFAASALAEIRHTGTVELQVLPGLQEIAAPPEDEPTFEGNARLKAIYYSRFLPGKIVLADDSGLEVDALGGAPGVRSARYAKDCGYLCEAGRGTDARNNLCLVAALAAVEEQSRQARYRCVLAAARDGVVLMEASGSVEGSIRREPEGSGGFGYDPYFVPAGETQSMAVLDQARRMELSHRGRALRHLLQNFDWISKADTAR